MYSQPMHSPCPSRAQPIPQPMLQPMQPPGYCSVEEQAVATRGWGQPLPMHSPCAAHTAARAAPHAPTTYCNVEVAGSSHSWVEAAHAHAQPMSIPRTAQPFVCPAHAPAYQYTMFGTYDSDKRLERKTKLTQTQRTAFLSRKTGEQR